MNAITANPINIPAGIQRKVLDIETVALASPAPTTIPIATTAFRLVGVELSVIPKTIGTQLINKKRRVMPAPQNRLVPSKV